MHESTVHDGFLLGDNLVAIAALETFLVYVAFMVAVLYLLEVPDDAELAHCCD